MQAIRFWMALWNKHLRDPNLTLLELDYIDLNIKNRSPVLYYEAVTQRQINSGTAFVRQPNYSNTGTWKQEFQLRLSTLDTLDNMLRFIRVRSAGHPVLSEMTGEFTDRLATERAQLTQYKRYFDDGRLR
ncbi:MAG: hypothetical protein NT105_17505 [Verrucomicrobia bacterium]|nr:hypothetical protein [Verrucomicrobiota bacterium]